jgi:hypothetical protein
MPGCAELRHERRAALYLLPDHEEGRARARPRESLEYGRCSLGMRAVVERQRNALRPV